MTVKDPMVREIHRGRAAYAKRLNYNISAIGEDIRRCEAESKGKFAPKTPQGGRQRAGMSRKSAIGA